MSTQVSIPKTDSIPLIILYRSLYILKQKFSKFKPQIVEIYKKYSINHIDNILPSDESIKNNLLQIKIELFSFKSVLKDLFPIINMLIVAIANPNELFKYDFISPQQIESLNKKITEQIYQYISDKLQKYNELYYSKKIYPLEVLKKYNVDERDNFPIVQYDKKGKIVCTFEQLKTMSDNFYNVVYPVKKEEIKYDSLEEIQKYQNILYIETLPVIIADFIQNNNMNAIIDLENEELSNEVRNLFDKEIFAKLSRDNKNILSEINENGIEKQKDLNDLLKEKLKIVKAIKLYDTIQVKKKQKGENVQYIEEIIARLNNEKNNIDITIKSKRLNSIRSELTVNQSDVSNMNKMLHAQTAFYNNYTESSNSQNKQYIISSLSSSLPIQSLPSQIKHTNPFVSVKVPSKYIANNLMTREELHQSIHQRNEVYDNKVTSSLDMIDRMRELQNAKVIERMERLAQIHQKMYPKYNKNY